MKNTLKIFLLLSFLLIIFFSVPTSAFAKSIAPEQTVSANNQINDGNLAYEGESASNGEVVFSAENPEDKQVVSGLNNTTIAVTTAVVCLPVAGSVVFVVVIKRKNQ